MASFMLCDFPAAVEWFSSVVEREPNNADGFNNLGHVLSKLGRSQEAVEALQRAVRLNPSLADAYANLSGALAALGRMDEAINAGQAALRINPRLANAYVNLGSQYAECGMNREAVECFRRVVEIDPKHVGSWSNLLMALQYSADLTTQDLYSAAAIWGQSQPQAPPDNRVWIQPERLRIGYVTADFCRHPSGYVMEKLVKSHDRSRVEVSCYGNLVGGDDITERIRAHTDRYHQIAGLSDSETADLIRQDGIHVLVDLSGHTAGNRLGVFALKPAPIQATYMGYFGTTGLQQIDYIMRDPAQIPDDEARYYTESVYQLRDGAFSFNVTFGDGRSLVPPCVKNGFITFGSFHNLGKVSGQTLKAWADVLKSVPDSQFLLSRKAFNCDAVRQRFLQLLGNQGVAAERIRFVVTGNRDEYLALYDEVDIVLDTFPFNGSTTIYEALAMGVPTVARSWDRMVGHFAESILGPCGHLDWVAKSDEEYVEIASRLAGDFEALTRMRVSLREDLLGSYLCNANQCASTLEDAYWDMWRRFAV
ncbi:MAG TPA: tetratricopeptide repeat protein [Fimbriimonas sp.]|nr:tetratricopeptide repeat protein [Fimbriimonas sp.]